jgi:hypothetical protein
VGGTGERPLAGSGDQHPGTEGKKWLLPTVFDTKPSERFGRQLPSSILKVVGLSFLLKPPMRLRVFILPLSIFGLEHVNHQIREDMNHLCKQTCGLLGRPPALGGVEVLALANQSAMLLPRERTAPPRYLEYLKKRLSDCRTTMMLWASESFFHTTGCLLS